MGLEIAIILLLIFINGVLAASEMAVVSAKPARLKMLADQGKNGARIALSLAEDPGRFLSSVQIGITLVGVIAGAFSGATLGARLTDYLIAQSISDGVADIIGVGAVVSVITYISLVFGELVPKQLALRHAEIIAARIAPLMQAVATIAAPLVWLLRHSSHATLWLLRQHQPRDDKITEEEIKHVIAEAEDAGVLDSKQRTMIRGVLRLADRSVRGIMTPRTDVDWIDSTEPESELLRQITTTPHARLPVCEGDFDNVIGVLNCRMALAAYVAHGKIDISSLVEPAPVVYDTLDAMEILPILKDAITPFAIVHDEYGHFEGIITPADVMEVVIGAFGADQHDQEDEIVRREDGSYLLPGLQPADEFAELLGITLPERRSYETLAGFLLEKFRRLPNTGERITANGWQFEIVDKDGNKIDKVLVSRDAAST